jgi:hypothetical protein
LKERALQHDLVFSFPYRASAPAEPATVLLGVSDTGQVRFSLLQKSSGDPHLDEVALAYLSGASFTPVASPMTWGFATISWGSDVYNPKGITP